MEESKESIANNDSSKQSTVPPFANVRSLFGFLGSEPLYGEQDALPRFIQGLNHFAQDCSPQERVKALRELYNQISSGWETFSLSVIENQFYRGSRKQKAPIVRSWLDEINRRIEEEMLIPRQALPAQDTAIVLRDKARQAFAVVLDGELQWLCQQVDVARIMNELKGTLKMNHAQLAKLAAKSVPQVSKKWNLESFETQIKQPSTEKSTLDIQTASEAVLPYLQAR